MSVIVYRDGVMAADTRAWSGDTAPIGNKMKIHRLKDGSLVGVTTSKPGIAEALVKWFNDGSDLLDTPEGPADFTALVVKLNGDVFYYADAFVPAGPIVAPYFAIGSGLKYALGAMTMGADAVQAVEASIANDVFCGAPVAALQLIEPVPETAAFEDLMAQAERDRPVEYDLFTPDEYRDAEPSQPEPVDPSPAPFDFSSFSTGVTMTNREPVDEALDFLTNS